MKALFRNDINAFREHVSLVNVIRRGKLYMAIAAHLDAFDVVKWLWKRMFFKSASSRQRYLEEWSCLAARTRSPGHVVLSLKFICEKFPDRGPSDECLRKMFWGAIVIGNEFYVEQIFDAYKPRLWIRQEDFFLAVGLEHIKVVEWMIGKGVDLSMIQSAVHILANRGCFIKNEDLGKYLVSYIRKGSQYIRDN